ncbi:hypothetical protein [Corynebacterium kroppenstedtii]
MSDMGFVAFRKQGGWEAQPVRSGCAAQADAAMADTWMAVI